MSLPLLQLVLSTSCPKTATGSGSSTCGHRRKQKQLHESWTTQYDTYEVPGLKRPPNFGLVETRPQEAVRMGYRGADKTATTYDLVEQIHYHNQPIEPEP
ncbi:hypothetical protein L2E82_36025 [Cichorium intybus]|uniref:Uncharacterized protein n=1 Tax=Cichorium intybus TaxID=13427 RepID=A0ACB9BQR9_CICIN|nr:hypothetical protein L2E82_36025 [Cichorium intybus]